MRSLRLSGLTHIFITTGVPYRSGTENLGGERKQCFDDCLLVLNNEIELVFT